ncbi:cytochrome c biogenesis protein CcdA [Clostridium aestuarii]|uniref:Cytochrome c biogenesis protein CcdA n=1 Tax=Clostridium aestuarii TaxID=338193 RepID=A0ABT4D2V4_9CLOT|nr:cytochrome c biogenesis protein CcdA [Clostridium aestuarii]MCY6485559.1 cytochrome c biogenesis protein CcdA [Clostridium aestuarii]
MRDINILLAFSAGVLSFLSPCVLPLIPGYITYLTGLSVEDLSVGRSKTVILKKSIGFVIGFSIVFILMGISVSSITTIFSNNRDIFRKIGGILIIIFGLHTMGVFRISFFYREKRLLNFNKGNWNLSSILMGMAFATGWTPCIGPILSSILIYAGSTSDLGKGIVLLVFYSAGLAVPFLLTALLMDKASNYIRKLYKYFPVISIISGLLLIVMGVMTFTNKLTLLNKYFGFIGN